MTEFEQSNAVAAIYKAIGALMLLDEDGALSVLIQELAFAAATVRAIPATPRPAPSSASTTGLPGFAS